jgi:chemotaxis protein CheX
MQATQAMPVSGKMIMPFVQSARDVFGAMVGVPTTVGKPVLKVSDELEHDVSAIIGFSGNVEGSMVITMESEVAVKIVQAFSGAEAKPGSADFADAMGELANMVAGSSKRTSAGLQRSLFQL